MSRSVAVQGSDSLSLGRMAPSRTRIKPAATAIKIEFKCSARAACLRRGRHAVLESRKNYECQTVRSKDTILLELESRAPRGRGVGSESEVLSPSRVTAPVTSITVP